MLSTLRGTTLTRDAFSRSPQQITSIGSFLRLTPHTCWPESYHNRAKCQCLHGVTVNGGSHVR
jgi:hypothetical protein